MKFLFLALVALLASCAAPSPAPKVAEPFDHSHAKWTAVLEQNVHGDRFDYAAVRRDRRALDAYLDQLRSVMPDEMARWSEEQRFAYWINAYNAFCVDLIVREAPRTSINDIEGVWKKRFIDLPVLYENGKRRKVSLDELENTILRPIFRDARVHAAVNCGSTSCAPLRPEAFAADQLDSQLDDQARKWLAAENANRFDAATGQAHLSKVFEWFEEDFEREGGVRAWVEKYAPQQHADWLQRSSRWKADFLEYQWQLNDTRE